MSNLGSGRDSGAAAEEGTTRSVSTQIPRHKQRPADSAHGDQGPRARAQVQTPAVPVEPRGQSLNQPSAAAARAWWALPSPGCPSAEGVRLRGAPWEPSGQGHWQQQSVQMVPGDRREPRHTQSKTLSED